MIEQNLAAVRERIEKAARSVGRSPADVRLVAVSKTKPAEAVRAAYAAGQRDFGENYAQELADKHGQLQDLTDIRWHFIGHLQSNKAKLVAPIASVIHTVDRASLAKELVKRARDKRLAVLIEVNIGGEAQKHGVAPDALRPVIDAVYDEPQLELRGLMTIPPADLDAARGAFEALARLREQHGGVEKLPELSMGMSDDLEIAIACGATLVRVGSAIFGARAVR